MQPYKESSLFWLRKMGLNVRVAAYYDNITNKVKNKSLNINLSILNFSSQRTPIIEVHTNRSVKSYN